MSLTQPGLVVLYDATCPLCIRCRVWLEAQRSWVPMAFLSCQSTEARERFGAVPWLGEELVVVGENGEVWAGAAAFIVCLWALVEWREWSYRISGDAFAPLAERFFHAVSSNRRALAALVRPDACESGTCRIPEAHRPRAAYR